MRYSLVILISILASACGSGEEADRWEPPDPPHSVFLSKDMDHHENDLQDAIRLWNDAAGRELVAFSGTTRSTTEPSQADGFSVVQGLTSWPPNFKSPETGRTLIAATVLKDEKGRIERDIYLNQESFDFEEPKKTGSSKPRFPAKIILAHELGHLLGLNHTEATEDIMHSESNPSQAFSLTPGDLEELEKIQRRPQ